VKKHLTLVAFVAIAVEFFKNHW